MSYELEITRINVRYFRKVIAGHGIFHHGDCRVFDSDICTCGLLHDLMVLNEPDKLYKDYYKEAAKQDKKLREMHEFKRSKISDETLDSANGGITGLGV